MPSILGGIPLSLWGFTSERLGQSAMSLSPSAPQDPRGAEALRARVRAVMVGSGKCSRSGNGSDGNGNPERISFPTAPSRPLPDLGLCSHRLPSRLTASCSRPGCFPSGRNVYSRLFPSGRNVYSRLFPYAVRHACVFVTARTLGYVRFL